MFRIHWTEEDEKDFASILSYYLENASFRVAKLVYARIKEEVETLKTFPEQTRIALVPKLQLGNPGLASPGLPYPRKLELPKPHSQAGAWEQATRWNFIHKKQA